MTIMFIAYRPAGRSTPPRFLTTLHSLGEVWTPATLTWLLNTHLDSSQVLNRLRTTLSSADDLLVMETTHRYATNLPEGDRDWLYKNVR